MTELVTLSNCDREPIHIPGSIQPHGAMLAVEDGIIRRHSTNIATITGLPDGPNGQSATALLGPDLVARIDEAIRQSDAIRPALLFDVTLPSGITTDIAAHLSNETLVLEFEPASADGMAPLQLTRRMMDRIAGVTRPDALADTVAEVVSETLGYDRVMVYEFAANGSGKVVAERKSDRLESFLGQHFPSADIPVQARKLYLRNTIRLISDASGARVALDPVLDRGLPLDLSLAHLRSVSPIHCEYLRNMGVGASMSVSIIVEGELWGLIACHHYSPRRLGMNQRVACEMFGEYLSLTLGALIRKRRLDTANATRAQLERLSRLTEVEDLDAMMRDNLDTFLRMIDADGIAVLMGGEMHRTGATPSTGDIRALAPKIAKLAGGAVWATDALTDHLPEAEQFHAEASGLLALPLSHNGNDWMLFFRREQVQTLDWAGNPDKTYGTGPMGDRLTPRKSFALWKEEVHRRARAWTEEDLETANALRTAVVEIVLLHNELLSEERAKADLRQRVLNDELNHRVKNILAVIKSVIGQPVEQGRTLESYVTSLKGRIQALSNAHDQVMRGGSGGPLAELLRAELSPYAGSAVLRLGGPEVMLDSRGFSVMAQVLHEMATNAAKYGALSKAGATLEVRWSAAPSGDCVIRWREIDGPTVIAPSRAGFGTSLVERSLPFDLGGSSKITYLPSGVEAEFILPARNIRFEETDLPLTQPEEPKAGPRLPHESHVLVLEDQLLIAMDIEGMLQDEGYERISLARNVEQALGLIATAGIELAMLDVNLGHETSIPVAEELRRRAIPFVFATGYDEASTLPEGMRDVPVVRKPYDVGALLDAFARATA